MRNWKLGHWAQLSIMTCPSIISLSISGQRQHLVQARMPWATASCPCIEARTKRRRVRRKSYTLSPGGFSGFDALKHVILFFPGDCPDIFEHQEDKWNYGRWMIWYSERGMECEYFTLSNSDADKCGKMKANRLWARASKSFFIVSFHCYICMHVTSRGRGTKPK